MRHKFHFLHWPALVDDDIKHDLCVIYFDAVDDHPVVLPCEALSENLRCNQKQVLPTPVLNNPKQDDQPRPHTYVHLYPAGQFLKCQWPLAGDWWTLMETNENSKHSCLLYFKTFRVQSSISLAIVRRSSKTFLTGIM